MRIRRTIRVRWPRWLALVAFVLQLGATVVAPVVHAQAEVLQSTREVEATHSDQCPRIHTDRTCLTCASYQVAPGPLQAFGGADRSDVSKAPGNALDPATRHDGSSRRLIRAPPAR